MEILKVIKNSGFSMLVKPSTMRRAAGIVCLTWFGVPLAGATGPQTESTSTSAPAASSEHALIDRYCVPCHNDRLETGGLSLEAADITNVATHAEVWERVVSKLRAGAMPPQPRPRPDRATYEHLATYLETALDRGCSGSRALSGPHTTRNAGLRTT